MSNECMSVPPVAVVPVDDDLSEMLVFAARYAIGRRTYAAADTARYIERVLKHLNSNDLRVMEIEISGARTLGDTCDEEAWLRLLALIRKELKDRKTK